MNRDPLGLGVLLYGMRPTGVLTASAWTVGPLAEREWELAHAGCSLTTFCKNPLHPGPCKGWKKKLGVDAPGALNAIEAARKEKLAKKRAATSQAKSTAAGSLTGRHLASPLHAKKATTKHANILLGDDETKASAKADKVILNKTEIKKYSKIKAAQVNDLLKQHGMKDDPGAEDRIAEALAADNKTGKDTEYRKVIESLAGHLGAKLAQDHCKEGDGDCDGDAWEELRAEFEHAAGASLAQGDGGAAIALLVEDYKSGDFKPAGIAAAKKAVNAPPEPEPPAAPPPALKKGEQTIGDMFAAADSAAPGEVLGKWQYKKDGHVKGSYEYRKGANGKIEVWAKPEGMPGFAKIAAWASPEEMHAAKKNTKTGPGMVTGVPGVVSPEMVIPDVIGKPPAKKAGPAPLEGNAAKAAKGMKFGLGIAAMLKGNKTLGTKAQQQAFADKLEKHHEGEGPEGLVSQAATDLATGVVLKPSKAKMSEPFVTVGGPAVKKAFALELAKEIEQGLKGEDGPTPHLDAFVKAIHAQQAKDWDGAKAAQLEISGLATNLPEWKGAQPATIADEVNAKPAGVPDMKPWTPQEEYLKHAKAVIDGEYDGEPIKQVGLAGLISKEQFEGELNLGEQEELLMKLEIIAATAAVPAVQDKAKAIYKKLAGDAMPPPSAAQEEAFPDKIDASSEPDVLQGLLDAIPEATGAVPAAPVLSAQVQDAKDVAHGVKSQTKNKKLETYEKVTVEEFQTLDPETQKLILADLKSIELGLLNPKKVKQAKEHHDYLAAAYGGAGGTGAGGGGNPGVGAGGANLAQALKDLHQIGELTKAPGTAPASKADMQAAYRDIVDAAGHEKAANAFSGTWADNALAAINSMHGGAFPQASLELAKPALAADIKKKLLGLPGPTPHLDALAKAKAFGDPDAAEAFLSGAISADLGPATPSKLDHMQKGLALAKLFEHASSVPTATLPKSEDLGAEISIKGATGYDTPGWDAFTKQQGQSLAAVALGTGFDSLGFNIDEKVELLAPASSHDLLTAMAAEMQQAVKDGDSLAPKGGWVDQLKDAVKTAQQAGDDLAAKNGWATDSPVVQEYKKTVIATKLDELGAKFKGTPAVHPTGGAGAGGTGGTATATPGSVTLGSGTKSGFTPEQNQILTGTLKAQGINLSSGVPHAWDVAVATAAAHQGKDGLPSSLTVLDVLNAVDEGHAENLGVTNGGLLRKKIVDWLGTPAGKQYAEANDTPKSAIMGKLTGDLSIKLPPGQKAQTLSGPGPYQAGNAGPWEKKTVAGAFAGQQAAWDAQPDVPWNTSKHNYHQPGWKTKWTDDQQDALYSYTLGSGTINNYLRGEDKYGKPVTTASHATKQTILDMQAAMAPLQEDHLLMRGTGWEQFPPGFRSLESVKKLVGQNVTEKAFLSTSIPGSGSSGFGGEVKMEIEAPKGTQAAFLEGLSAFKGGSEQEMLLGAGQVMRVLSVKKVGHQTVVRVRIVTPQ